jgi:tRNA modification GTPase
LADLQSRLEAVISASQQGSLLREGLRVALAGRPNVGKSSLLNRLAGEEIAIVTDIPGTTRDAIRQSISIEGVPVHIIDTAGLRPAIDAVERIGIARAWAVIEHADLVLLLLDAAQGETADDREIRRGLPSGPPRITVMNKIDLVPRAPAVEQVGGNCTVWLSAKSGEGIDLLRRVLLETVGWKQGGEGLFMARERHLHALRLAQQHLELASRETGKLEILAEELRLSLQALGSIKGEFSSDDLLGEIFSRFCIGK